MKFSDWIRKLNNKTNEELVFCYLQALASLGEEAVDYLNACRCVMIHRFIDDVIYFPTDWKDGDKSGNSDND